MSTKLFELLLQASIYTVTISVVSILIGFAISIIVSAMLLSRQRLFMLLGQVFISFFRGVPLLVQLLLIYNLLPVIGINVPSIVAAVVGLSLCTAAYQAENLRGGFASVPSGLVESAEMVGLTPMQIFRRIKAPIALRLTFPALVNEAILILKASSLVSVVGIVELTRMAQDLAGSTFLPLEIFASAGLIYLAINWIVALAGGLIERSLPGAPR
ncbi:MULTISPECIES: amino acid ABC transporter permease [Rhizobium]|uniref:amino acid ABC transporter permease n=1 Tax=Rhizobium TaxID=379 RepID=UPI001B33CD3E|nr:MULTISPECIES: amino acid ABC transporter permease [Rhizobium]MBX4909736.1 amino acid ABC transporter permease [Rhizobium bangladeshense]MBX5216639.1 amino acid ABC transporter permease [Rhizobium sp. NLR9a]MBX5224651.1 amino acid ABC transporter permease [Rhizobium sp. NLR8a]MBX5228546.1 amino acid ABC transporter permease [Rhizobium sp. NLR9b]MBX5234986.1 amino acid ABC transporter permease [Rhizobium sp. NLR4a]